MNKEERIYPEENYIVERLSLRTKERYINDIISGKQKEENRQLSVFYANRLLHFIDRKREKWDAVKQVKQLHLYAGNVKGCKFVDVTVTRTLLVQYLHSIPPGRKKGDMEFVFELGDVISYN
jgi:hypothetical protein